MEFGIIRQTQLCFVTPPFEMILSSDQFSEIVQNGAAAWVEFTSRNPLPHTISGYISKPRADFSNFSFKDIIFDGCWFKSCKFSDTTFTSCTFNDSQFYNCGLATSRFENCFIENLDFSKGTLRNIEISHANGKTLVFEQVAVERLRMVDISLEVVRATGCSRFDASMRGLLDVEVCISQVDSGKIVLSDSTLTGIEFENSHFDLVDFSFVRVGSFANRSSILKILDVDNSRLEGFLFHPTGSENVRLAGSQLRGADLNDLDLAIADFTDTSLVDCKWPDQDGRVSLLGKFSPPKNPLMHPVHDVKGISNQLRSDIATTQFIKSLQDRSTSSIGRRLSMRLWGMSTSFGLSPFRFVVFGLVFILIVSIFEASSIYLIEFPNRYNFGITREVAVWSQKNFETVYNNLIFAFSFAEANKDTGIFIEKVALWAIAAFRLIFLALMISLLANFVTRTLNY